MSTRSLDGSRRNKQGILLAGPRPGQLKVLRVPGVRYRIRLAPEISANSVTLSLPPRRVTLHVGLLPLSDLHRRLDETQP